MIVYIVLCQHCYEDYYDLPSAKAFFDKEKAQGYCDKCFIEEGVEDAIIEEYEVVE